MWTLIYSVFHKNNFKYFLSILRRPIEVCFLYKSVRKKSNFHMEFRCFRYASLGLCGVGVWWPNGRVKSVLLRESKNEKESDRKWQWVIYKEMGRKGHKERMSEGEEKKKERGKEKRDKERENELERGRQKERKKQRGKYRERKHSWQYADQMGRNKANRFFRNSPIVI